MDHARFAKDLQQELGLERPPVGLAFLEEPPPGVPRFDQAAPSACAFWKAAEKSLFYAEAEDHYNCPIGAITQGFDLPQPVLQQGMDLIGQMGKIQYFEASEAGHVPKVTKPHRVVVYGPLESFTNFLPDVALLVCSPYQAMLLAEISGAVAWRGAQGANLFGRPACAVIPQALSDDAFSASLACKGARTFAGIGDREMLLAIPASQLQEASVRFASIMRANAEMQRYYDGRQAQFKLQ